MLTKTLVATVLAGGILITGATWMGTEKIENIKNNIVSMEEKFISAVSDNDFLKGRFNGLSDKFNNLNELYNDTISDRDKLQNEVTRLESELEKANTEITELETYSKEVDESMEYEEIDRGKEFQIVGEVN